MIRLKITKYKGSMKIYTKTGDDGFTSLYDGGRVSKADLIPTALGDIDELSSMIGHLHSLHPDRNFRNIQSVLQDIGSILATPSAPKHNTPTLSYANVEILETTIDKMEVENAPLTKFILPGVGQADSYAHLCRSVCRRAERSLLRVPQELPDVVHKYINRLSDYFFVYARWLCTKHSLRECFYKDYPPYTNE